jgi:uncharacterized membrane protein
MDRDPRPGNGFYWQEAPHHGHDGWWDGPFHAILFLLLIALLIVGIVWLLRRLFPALTIPATAPALAQAQAAAIAADPAVAALRMRYAKGEVSREDFQNALTDLTGAGSAEPWPGDAPGEDTAPTAS